MVIAVTSLTVEEIAASIGRMAPALVRFGQYAGQQVAPAVGATVGAGLGASPASSGVGQTRNFIAIQSPDILHYDAAQEMMALNHASVDDSWKADAQRYELKDDYDAYDQLERDLIKQDLKSINNELDASQRLKKQLAENDQFADRQKRSSVYPYTVSWSPSSNTVRNYALFGPDYKAAAVDWNTQPKQEKSLSKQQMNHRAEAASPALLKMQVMREAQFLADKKALQSTEQLARQIKARIEQEYPDLVENKESGKKINVSRESSELGKSKELIQDKFGLLVTQDPEGPYYKYEYRNDPQVESTEPEYGYDSFGNKVEDGPFDKYGKMFVVD